MCVTCSSPTIYFLLFRIISKSFYCAVVNGTSSIAVSNCNCVAASVLYEPSEQVSDNVEVVRLTPSGLTANVNNSSMGNDNIFIAYRRADLLADCNVLTIVDICVIVSSKVHQTPYLVLLATLFRIDRVKWFFVVFLSWLTSYRS